MDGSRCFSPPRRNKQRAERDKIAFGSDIFSVYVFSDYLGQSRSIFLIGNGLREQGALTSSVKTRKQSQLGDLFQVTAAVRIDPGPS